MELSKIKIAIQEGRSSKAIELIQIPERYRGKKLRNTEQARTALKALNNGKSLFLTGACGSGKTELAVTLAQEWFAKDLELNEHGHPVNPRGVARFLSVPNLFLDIKALWSNDEGRRGESEKDIVERYGNIPLLILDDLGAEKPSEWTRSVLYAVLNKRYEKCRQTIITSNKSLEQLASEDDDRIASRICEMGVVISMGGKDWRVNMNRNGI